MNEALSIIKSPEMKAQIIKRCEDENPTPQGITCPYCGAREVYSNSAQPMLSAKWSWIIRAFKIDNYSECRNCKSWFNS